MNKNRAAVQDVGQHFLETTIKESILIDPKIRNIFENKNVNHMLEGIKKTAKMISVRSTIREQESRKLY